MSLAVGFVLSQNAAISLVRYHINSGFGDRNYHKPMLWHGSRVNLGVLPPEPLPPELLLPLPELSPPEPPQAANARTKVLAQISFLIVTPL